MKSMFKAFSKPHTMYIWLEICCWQMECTPVSFDKLVEVLNIKQGTLRRAINYLVDAKLIKSIRNPHGENGRERVYMVTNPNLFHALTLLVGEYENGKM